VYVSPKAEEVAEAARGLRRAGVRDGACAGDVCDSAVGLPLPFLTRTVHYFVARKTMLLPPGKSSERSRITWSW